MRLVIVAATGGIGHELLEQSAGAGHDVTAVVRDPTRLSRPVSSVAVDLADPDPDALKSAVNGCDAVLSGLGPRSKSDTGVASTGTAAIVDAMQATGNRRLVVVSAAPIGTVRSPARPHAPRHDPGDGFFMRHLFAPLTKLALRSQYRDLAAHGSHRARQRARLDHRPSAPSDRQAPRFQGQAMPTLDAKARARARRPELAESNLKAVEMSTAKYEAERDAAARERD
jgi:hypothetical protein